MMMMMMMMMMMINCFMDWLVDEFMTSALRFSLSQTSATARVRFKPLQSLSSNSVEESRAVLAIAAPWRH